MVIVLFVVFVKYVAVATVTAGVFVVVATVFALSLSPLVGFALAFVFYF